MRNTGPPKSAGRRCHASAQCGGTRFARGSLVRGSPAGGVSSGKVSGGSSETSPETAEWIMKKH